MTKVSLSLPAEDVATLKELAARRKTTLTQALRQAIASEKLLDDEIRAGSKVLIKRGNTVSEVIFRP
jgi:hypothetical protein